MPRRVKVAIGAIAFTLAALLLIFVLAGCHRVCSSGVPDSSPAAQGSLSKAQAQIDSAEQANSAAKPLAGKIAGPLLEQVSAEHKSAQVSLRQTSDSIMQSQKERDRVEQLYADQVEENRAIKADAYYRAAMFIKHLVHFLTVAALIFVLIEIFEPLIPAPIGTGIRLVTGLLNVPIWPGAIGKFFFARAPSAGAVGQGGA